MQDENNDSSDDTALRDELITRGFNPDAGGMRWMAAQPKILVVGAYQVIRTAAERARKMVEKSR